MNNKLTRTAVAVASAGAVAAGMMAAAAGTAAAAPGDLSVKAYAKCVSSHGKAATDRVITVKNVGDTTVKNIRVAEVNGPEHGIPRIAVAADNRDGTEIGPLRNGMRYYSLTGVKKANELAPGEEVKIWHVVPGCSGPWAMAGYAIGSPADNVFNAPNGEFRWGATQPPRERN